MEIKSRFDHYNINVLDLQKSLDFYQKALGLKEVRRKESSDGSFILVYIGDNTTGFTLELTWLRDWDRPWATTSNTCVCVSRMITTKLVPSTRKWVVFVMKTKRWDYILSTTPMDIG